MGSLIRGLQKVCVNPGSFVLLLSVETHKHMCNIFTLFWLILQNRLERVETKDLVVQSRVRLGLELGSGYRGPSCHQGEPKGTHSPKWFLEWLVFPPKGSD